MECNTVFRNRPTLDLQQWCQYKRKKNGLLNKGMSQMENYKYIHEHTYFIPHTIAKI